MQHSLDIPHALRRQPAAPVAPPIIQQRPVGTPWGEPVWPTWWPAGSPAISAG